MLPQEIRDIIKKESDEISFLHHAKGGYISAATKYAELMIEFAEWALGRGNWRLNPHSEETRWRHVDQIGERNRFLDEGISTSDLLTIFLKEKSNLANENNIL